MLQKNKTTLMEGAICELLRRDPTIELHEILVNAPLIYEQQSREFLATLYEQYINVARKAGLPFTMCTPTWRCNRERVENSAFPLGINRDVTSFMRDIADNNSDVSISLGGLIGCKNDCYLAEQALPTAAAKEFALWQVKELVEGGVDYLIAETLPELNEAIGIAQAMSETDRPYYISYVIGAEGTLLDGHSLGDAIECLDQSVLRQPEGYLVNCSYPTFLQSIQLSPEQKERFIGLMANGSSLSHVELESAENLEQEPISQWVKSMLWAKENFDLTILGGCCGTSPKHLQELISQM